MSKVKAVVSEQFGAVSSAVSKGLLTANDGIERLLSFALCAFASPSHHSIVVGDVMCDVLCCAVVRSATAKLIQLKYTVLLLCKTLSGYGFHVHSLYEFLSGARELFEGVVVQRLRSEIKEVWVGGDVMG